MIAGTAGSSSPPKSAGAIDVGSVFGFWLRLHRSGKSGSLSTLDRGYTPKRLLESPSIDYQATDGVKDVTVTTDDFLREQMERSQRQRTRRRRDGRSRRRHLYLTVGLGILALLVLAAPSLVSHSSIGRSLLIHELAGYGFEATASSVRVGWITPLRITGLKVKGPSGGSELELERLDMELTVTDLISGSGDQWGEVVLRGVHLNCRMREGRCSLEDDLSALLDSPAESTPFSIDLKLQDLTIAVSDEVTGAIWQVAQSSGDIQLNQRETIASFAGVVGAARCKAAWNWPPAAGRSICRASRCRFRWSHWFDGG